VQSLIIFSLANTKTGFAVYQEIYRRKKREADWVSVYLEIQHNCSDFEQTFWQVN
jgi:hypothetical protein